MIQSVNNKKIKEYAKLIQKKERDKTNLFLVEGEHMVKEAFNANALQELFILEGIECPVDFNYETVTQQVLNKLSNQNSNSKMIGVCKKLNLKPEKEENILLLDNVQDPGNVGTILRTAHSFGIDCIYMSKGCADIYNPKTIQSSQGALFYIPVIQTDLVEEIKKLQERNIEVYATALHDNHKDLQDIKPSEKYAILVGNEEKVLAAAEKSGYNIRGAEIIDPENFDRIDEMVALFCELRKSKGVSEEQARKVLKGANYFGTMLVKMGIADALLGGATYSTADTVRPALQLIKTKPGNKIVSSCFILVRPSATGENEVLAMGDCAINIKPTEDDLVEICGETAECAKIFGIDPKVAFLSYSTLGSGKGEDVDKMRNAATKAKAAYPGLPIEGELQFDAAVAPRVARTKCPNSEVAGHANTFIFPDINAGNIGYKIAQRLGNFEAYGPILLGLNAPINDLSRGCNAIEVYSMAIITASLAVQK